MNLMIQRAEEGKDLMDLEQPILKRKRDAVDLHKSEPLTNKARQGLDPSDKQSA